MAIQTAAQLKAAFGADGNGIKFASAQNWSDLIDTITAEKQFDEKEVRSISLGYITRTLALEGNPDVTIDEIISSWNAMASHNTYYQEIPSECKILIIHNDSWGYTQSDSSTMPIYVKTYEGRYSSWGPNSSNASKLWNEKVIITAIESGEAKGFVKSTVGWQPIYKPTVTKTSYTLELNAYDYTPGNDDNNYGNTPIIGATAMSTDSRFEYYDSPSGYSPIKVSDLALAAGCDSPSIGTTLFVHNDGAFYYEGDATQYGEVYIQWSLNGGGSYWDLYANDPRFYQWNQGRITTKPQISVLPVGATIAFVYMDNTWQPIGNTIMYDYDELMQKVQQNPRS